MGACTSTVSDLQSFATIGTQGEKHSSREGLQRPPQDIGGTDASFVCDFAFSVSQSERNITFAVLGGDIKREQTNTAGCQTSLNAAAVATRSAVGALLGLSRRGALAAPVEHTNIDVKEGEKRAENVKNQSHY